MTDTLKEQITALREKNKSLAAKRDEAVEKASDAKEKSDAEVTALKEKITSLEASNDALTAELKDSKDLLKTAKATALAEAKEEHEALASANSRVSALGGEPEGNTQLEVFTNYLTSIDRAPAEDASEQTVVAVFETIEELRGDDKVDDHIKTTDNKDPEPEAMTHEELIKKARGGK